MSNSIAPGSSADVNVKVTALTTNPNVPAQYKTIILKKNLVNEVNTLTQEMMSAANTKYVVKYNYVLGEDITVPVDCILEFDGGSISGEHTIIGNNTGIKAGLIKIFNTDVTLANTWNVAEAYPEWFGAKGDGVTDDTIPFQKCVNSFNKTTLIHKYKITSTINVPSHRIISSARLSPAIANSTDDYNIIFVSNEQYGIIVNKGCKLIGINIINKTSDYNPTDEITLNSVGIRIRESEVKIEFCNARWFSVGFESRAFMSKFELCLAHECGIGYYIHGVTDDFPSIDDSEQVHETTISVENCYSNTCRYYGFYIKDLSGSNFVNCACDGVGINSVSLTSDQYIYPAYFIENCNNCVFTNLCAEVCMRLLKIKHLRNCIITNPSISLGYVYNGQTTQVIGETVGIYSCESVTIENPVYFTIPTQVSIVTTGNYQNVIYDTDNDNGRTNLRLIIGRKSEFDTVKLWRFIGTNPDLFLISVDIIYKNNFTRGDSQSRPTLHGSVANTPLPDYNQTYFDLSINKPIYWVGRWVDATGATV